MRLTESTCIGNESGYSLRDIRRAVDIILAAEGFADKAGKVLSANLVNAYWKDDGDRAFIEVEVDILHDHYCRHFHRTLEYIPEADDFQLA